MSPATFCKACALGLALVTGAAAAQDVNIVPEMTAAEIAAAKAVEKATPLPDAQSPSASEAPYVPCNPDVCQQEPTRVASRNEPAN